jgi:YD repeat-containing protein
MTTTSMRSRRWTTTAIIIACLALGAPAASQQVSYSYDDAGRLTRVDYDNGASIQYVYDAAGNLLQTTTTPAAPAGPRMTVLSGGAEIANAQPAAISFGAAALAAAAPTRTFTVRNDGNAALSALAVSPPAGFLLDKAPAASLAAGAADTFVLRLDTTAAGGRTGAVSIASNDPHVNPFTFPVTGVVSASAPLSYDFGTADSPVEPGYRRVAETTSYSPATGFGWRSGSIQSRDRAVGGALTRDLNLTTLGTFVVDVPNGTYDVTVTCGDASATHDQMGLLLEGVLVDTLTTAANHFETRTYRVTVADAQLTMTLHDLGGSDANAVINALVVESADVRPHQRLTR